jgi:hypothetical protein
MRNSPDWRTRYSPADPTSNWFGQRLYSLQVDNRRQRFHDTHVDELNLKER